MAITKNTTKEELLKLVYPCKCTACTVGCLHGSGCLIDEDIKPLASFLNVDEETLKKNYLEEVEKFNTKKFRPKILREGKQFGKCIFFDEKKGCTVHDAKPFECKIAMGCKDYGEQISLWFMLNEFVNENDPESVRQFASYLKTGGKTLEHGRLEDFVKDKEKLRKILNYEILK